MLSCSWIACSLSLVRVGEGDRLPPKRKLAKESKANPTGRLGAGSETGDLGVAESVDLGEPSRPFVEVAKVGDAEGGDRGERDCDELVEDVEGDGGNRKGPLVT